jgi:hypothetical protein
MVVVLRGLLGMGVVTFFVAGCGGGAQTPRDLAKTRFAIAQFIELQVASIEGATQNGNALSTVCTSQSNTVWICSSVYLPPEGEVTSVNQDVADTKATYEVSGAVRFTAANLVAGRGLKEVLSAAELRKFIARDGKNVGAMPQQTGQMRLTGGELAKESMSTLSTLVALLSPAQQAAFGQTTQASTQSTPQPAKSTQQPTDTTGATAGSTSSGAAEPPLPTSPPPLGPPCGTVTGGPDDYQGAMLTVRASAGVSCATAIRLLTNLSAGRAATHQGSADANSWFALDGWTCPYGNMGTQSCYKGNLYIEATAPGAQP